MRGRVYTIDTQPLIKIKKKILYKKNKMDKSKMNKDGKKVVTPAVHKKENKKTNKKEVAKKEIKKTKEKIQKTQSQKTKVVSKKRKMEQPPKNVEEPSNIVIDEFKAYMTVSNLSGNTTYF